MLFRCLCSIVIVSIVAESFLSNASAQTIGQICKEVDCLSQELRDDGLIIIKQPDVFSPARLTHYRRDFETQMQSDLGNFHLVLAARINRLDAATTTQTSNLANALGSSPPVSYATLTTPYAAGAAASLPTTPFSSVGLQSGLTLGVEPTVYLDEKKRFLEHLNQIRRINMGPDQNDSSGYGLYLIRIPVSITPGKRTGQGFGAELSIKAEHEFGADFLSKTFRGLVINDIVDQLSPVIYEIIRSGRASYANEIDAFLSAYDHEIASFDELKRKTLERYESDAANAFVEDLFKNYQDRQRLFIGPLSAFILRDDPGLPRTGDAGKLVANRIQLLIDARTKVKGSEEMEKSLPGLLRLLQNVKQRAERSESYSKQDRFVIQAALLNVLDGFLWQKSSRWGGDVKRNEIDRNTLDPFVNALWNNAMDDEKPDLVLGFDAIRDPSELSQLLTRKVNLQTARSLPSTRNPKQIYPIAPREIQNFFIEDNIYRLARDAEQSMITQVSSATDVRNYLRHTLSAAFDLMTTAGVRPDSSGISVGVMTPPPLSNTDSFFDRLLVAVRRRGFAEIGNDSDLRILFSELVRNLSATHDNIVDPVTRLPNQLAALCWAIALDATLLDEALKADVAKYSAQCGVSPDTLAGIHFYSPDDHVASGIFNDYVKNRWPIITFALDPVVDQQNLADSATMTRDLQLALAYAFSTGQISFGQMNTFRRQIQQSADTIALNRTVTGFAHGNDQFGFRFTPRFQNPPNQKTNIGVIATQLICGGPGPNYQIRKSKLEPGIRELTAVMLLPTFLPTMRVDVGSNWFRLTHPAKLIYSTERMLEQGRCVQELRSTIQACDTGLYRADDVRNLQVKLDQLDLMLKSRSTVLQLPFENTASGFELFSDGATALVPELSGFDGIDVVTQGQAADVFIYGKYINLLDTKVIVGGKALPDSAVEILSREVVHITIPPDAAPTVTKDSDAPRTYLELYLATANGLSNRLLIPSAPAAKTLAIAYDLNADSKVLQLYYQWLADPDTKQLGLVLTADPGKVTSSPLKITWDSPTGLAPKTLQATFIATVNGQTLRFALQADSGVKDDFGVDRQQLGVCLLKELQSITPSSSALPASISFDVYVQPFIPLDSFGYRVQSAPKKLATQLTVKFQSLVTGKNALPPDVKCTALSEAPAGPLGLADARITKSGGTSRKELPAAAPKQQKILKTAYSEEIDEQTPEQVPQLISQSAPLVPVPFVSPAVVIPNQLPALSTLPVVPPNQPPAIPDPTKVVQQTAAAAATAAPQIFVSPAPVIVAPPTPEKKKHKPLFRTGRLMNFGGGAN